MITLSRSLLRQVRSVFRRAGIGKRPTGPGSCIRMCAGPDGLQIRGQSLDAAIEYHEPGRLQVEQYVLPGQFLEDCHGRRDHPVVLEECDADHVLAHFTDGGVPQLFRYQLERTQSLHDFPQMPERINTSEPRLLTGLREAQSVTDDESTRYALGCIQLRGSQGCLAATDGRRIYRQSGFQFAWTEDLLIAGANVLQSSEFRIDQPVGVGRAGDWIVLILGSWKVWLRINTLGRFPSIDSIFPDPASACTRVQFAREDVDFLRQGLSQLPNHDESEQAITLDFRAEVAIRTKCPRTPHPTELILRRSQVSGVPVAININRPYLASAISMKFQELSIFGPDKPVLYSGSQRQYLCCVLDSQAVIKPDNQAIRVESIAVVESPDCNRKASSHPVPSSEFRRTIPVPNKNEVGAPDAANKSATSNGQSDSLSPIEQAESLRGTLREALVRTSDLIASLRRQRKQTRLMKSTLDSLKELQRVAG